MQDSLEREMWLNSDENVSLVVPLRLLKIFKKGLADREVILVAHKCFRLSNC